MQRKDYDSIAIKDEKSLWNILTLHCANKQKREAVLAEYKKLLSYEDNELFDELNRTKYKHKQRDKNSKKKILEPIKKELNKDNKEQRLKDILTDESKIEWNKYLKDQQVVHYHKWGNRNVATIYNIEEFEKEILQAKETKSFEGRLNKNKYLEWAKNFFIYQKIPLNKFDLNEFEIEYISRYEDYVFSLKYDRSFGSDRFKEEYVNRFINIIENTHKKILIYDYTDKYPRKDKVLEPYYNAHKELYEKIEYQIEHSKKLQYTRVIALPHGDHLSSDHSIRDLYLKFTKVCSKVLFEHICSTLSQQLINDTDNAINISDDESIEEEDKIVIQTGFYVINKCSRIYQFALLDDIVVTELYRFHVTGKCYPDVLFIEQLHEKHPHYLITYKEFRSIFKENKFMGDRNKKFDEIDLLYKIDEEVFLKFGELLEELIDENRKKKISNMVLNEKVDIFKKYKKIHEKKLKDQANSNEG